MQRHIGQTRAQALAPQGSHNAHCEMQMSNPHPGNHIHPHAAGARFYRCALQVNPFAYLEDYGNPGAFHSEKEYNQAIIDACHTHAIEAIAVTDHYRVQTAQSLIHAAEEAGITVFPGFEAVTKDGVHLLCLFDPGTEMQYLDRILGACGIHQEPEGSPVGKYDVIDFLTESRQWQAVCIAAHVTSQTGGLLAKLTGRSRINAWCSAHLIACSLPGPVADAAEGLRRILENKDGEHRRERPVTILNATDVNQPEDLAFDGASCWIKMSEVTVEGLRQAFLDSESRVRLNDDYALPHHAAIVSIAWEGGFLDGTEIPLNPNLNVLIGGRGTGKSTIIESLRYALGLPPAGDEACKLHASIVQNVLGPDARISLRVCCHRPDRREYRIERTVPHPPVVYQENGQLSSLRPEEILTRIEVYGQHEIAELARDAQKRTRLIERFVEREPSREQQKSDIQRDLAKSRQSLTEVQEDLEQTEERLASLPGLEEKLQRYQEIDWEDRYRERRLLNREQRMVKSFSDRLQPFDDSLEVLTQELPIDRTFVSARALAELPSQAILADAEGVLTRLSAQLEEAKTLLAQSLKSARAELAQIERRWESHKNEVQAAYERILRELENSASAGEEFIQLQQQIEELQQYKATRNMLQRSRQDLLERRKGLLVAWHKVNTQDFQRLHKAARKVSRKLANQVLVKVTAAGDRSQVIQILREEISGRLSETLKVLSAHPEFSLSQFTAACRKGPQEIQQLYDNIPANQSRMLADLPESVLMRIEELELPATTAISLNTEPAGHRPHWRTIENLSIGQRATAILLLLFLESDAPLIIDQPEDDLDNRFITEGVIPRLREEKFKRQLVFATHNANVPVLGDAEMVLGLTADSEKAQIAREHMNSIDVPSVREMIEEILEGGKKAFETRRLKYGF